MGHDEVSGRMQDRIEQEAVRTTIVGGRPPGSGKGVGAVPRGIEVLLKKAAVDAGFRAELVEHRAAAADRLGLALTTGEVMMLRAVSARQLQQMIEQTKVPAGAVAALMGQAAAGMLLALGLVQATGCQPEPTNVDELVVMGLRAHVVQNGIPMPTTASSLGSASGPATTTGPALIKMGTAGLTVGGPSTSAGQPTGELLSRGIRPDMPPATTSGPATQTQPGANAGPTTERELDRYNINIYGMTTDLVRRGIPLPIETKPETHPAVEGVGPGTPEFPIEPDDGSISIFGMTSLLVRRGIPLPIEPKAATHPAIEGVGPGTPEFPVTPPTRPAPTQPSTTQAADVKAVNTYTGATTIAGGTLYLGTASTVPTQPATQTQPATTKAASVELSPVSPQVYNVAGLIVMPERKPASAPNTAPATQPATLGQGARDRSSPYYYPAGIMADDTPPATVPATQTQPSTQTRPATQPATGTLILTPGKTYSGRTIISAGVLKMDAERPATQPTTQPATPTRPASEPGAMLNERQLLKGLKFAAVAGIVSDKDELKIQTQPGTQPATQTQPATEPTTGPSTMQAAPIEIKRTIHGLTADLVKEGIPLSTPPSTQPSTQTQPSSGPATQPNTEPPPPLITRPRVVVFGVRADLIRQGIPVPAATQPATQTQPVTQPATEPSTQPATQPGLEKMPGGPIDPILPRRPIIAGVQKQSN